MDRYDKMEWLLETCSSEFIKDCRFLQEMVSWMGEKDFNEFYEHVCSQWEIKEPEDLDAAMNEFVVEGDQFVFTA